MKRESTKVFYSIYNDIWEHSSSGLNISPQTMNMIKYTIYTTCGNLA